MKKAVSIVMYHYVREIAASRYPRIKGLELNHFMSQIEFFEKNYNIITMEELQAAVLESYELPERSLLLTFDDGYIDAFLNVLPILESKGHQGSFFVSGKTFVEHKLLDVNKIHFTLASAPITKLCSELFNLLDYYRGTEYSFPSNGELYEKYAKAERFDDKETIFFKRVLQMGIPEKLRNEISSLLFEQFVGLPEESFARELYLNENQIEYMKKKGMFFGVHGYDHYWMNQLSAEELGKDLDLALKSMEGLIERQNWVINYPYGSYDEQAVQIARNKGAVLGVTTEVRRACLENDSPMLLPRLDTNDYPPKSDQYLRIK